MTKSTRRFKSEGLCVGSLCSAAVFRPISVKTALVLCRCSTVSSTFHADLASQACQAPTELTQILPSQQFFLSISCSQLGVPLDFCDTTKQRQSLNYRQVGSSTNLILRPSQQSQHAPASGLSGKECQGLHTQPRILAAFSPNTGRVLRSASILRLPSVFSPPRPSPTDPAASDRLSVFPSTRPDTFCCAPSPRSSHQTHPSLGFFWLAVNRVEPGQETSIGANCHSLTSRRVVSLVLATCLSVASPTDGPICFGRAAHFQNSRHTGRTPPQTGSRFDAIPVPPLSSQFAQFSDIATLVARCAKNHSVRRT